MVSAMGDKSTTGQKGPNKSLLEARSNKIAKRTRERKQVKSFDADAAIEAAEASPESEDTQDNKEKRSQAIVIDGRTYTCATCKTGHRVGICKHARERPMTATHPPGRPSAGVPKKVVCDCPRQCSCKKRGCKCARTCNCTQVMYMLVYVPAPGEENHDEEKGTWKLGHSVTTDLKGNILSPQEVKQRQEQKEAQKIQAPDIRRSSTSQSNSIESNTITPAMPDTKPEAIGGCCKHKENVASRKIAAEASLLSEEVSEPSADGCNCGSNCICAFCPQHPNNATSINMAREQAMHFANQPYSHNDQPIVPMMSNVQQGASCMGGLPQFAISRYSERPSRNDLQRAFPHRGYVIAYPIWSTRTDHAGFPVAPFPTQPQFTPNPSMMPDGATSDLQTPFNAAQIVTNPQEATTLSYSQDEFGIGNAFVASAGTDGTWDPRFVSSRAWATENLVQAPFVEGFLNAPDFWDQSTSHSELPAFTTTPTDPVFDCSNNLNIPEASPLYDLAGPASFSASETPYEGRVFGNQSALENYFYTVEDDTPSIMN